MLHPACCLLLISRRAKLWVTEHTVCSIIGGPPCQLMTPMSFPVSPVTRHNPRLPSTFSNSTAIHSYIIYTRLLPSPFVTCTRVFNEGNFALANSLRTANKTRKAAATAAEQSHISGRQSGKRIVPFVVSLNGSGGVMPGVSRAWRPAESYVALQQYQYVSQLPRVLTR